MHLHKKLRLIIKDLLVDGQHKYGEGQKHGYPKPVHRDEHVKCSIYTWIYILNIQISVYPIFSPESGGRQNTNSVRDESIMQGKMTLWM